VHACSSHAGAATAGAVMTAEAASLSTATGILAIVPSLKDLS
jgi:hypothetical protein